MADLSEHVDYDRARVTNTLRVGSYTFVWGSRTYVMGIINVTPDSFSGDGLAFNVRSAAMRAEALQRAGADIIDVGGESTRPGHVPVPAEEELRRVAPAMKAIASSVSVPISVDTRKAAIARVAIEAGAAIVNDVSGLMADADMAATVKEFDVPVIVMARGHSRTPDVITRVREDLDESLRRAAEACIERTRLIVDPGFGFGKDWRDNLQLLRRLGEIAYGYAYPLLVGLSRKSVITRVLGSEPEHRQPANAALTALAIAGGADIVRVHDVAALMAAVRMADAAMRSAGVPAAARG